MALTALARQLARLGGWQIVGKLPDVPRLVVIVYPHTSNWDLPVGLICGLATGAFSRWHYGFMMKQDVFRGPFGSVMRAIGGIPIDRNAAHDVVTHMTEAFQTHDRFMLVVTPEGTRKLTLYWKSGFYHIALDVGAPILPVAFDYGRRIFKLGEVVVPTGDIEADLAMFRSFFAGVTPMYPGNAGDIRFRDPTPLTVNLRP